MTIDKKDLKIEFFKAPGPGGQRKNKVKTACKVTHIPSGVTATVNTRSPTQSKHKAIKNLEEKLKQIELEKKAAAKKARRDAVIHDKKYIRTYNYQRNEVKDHRTGKIANLKLVLEEGRFDLLNPDYE